MPSGQMRTVLFKLNFGTPTHVLVGSLNLSGTRSNENKDSMT